MGLRGELFSTTVVLDNRTYFFNVKENRTGDVFLNVVESKSKEGDAYERHQIVLFADDMQRFLKGFEETLKYMDKEMAARNKKVREAAKAKKEDDESRPVRKTTIVRKSSRPTGDRPSADRQAPDRPHGERPSPLARGPRSEGGSKPESRERKPYEKKSFERKPYDKKPREGSSYEKKPYEKRSSGGASFDKKPYEKKSFDKKPYEKKTFERKPYDKKPQDGNGAAGNRKTFAERKSGDGPKRKPEGGARKVRVVKAKKPE